MYIFSFYFAGKPMNLEFLINTQTYHPFYKISETHKVTCILVLPVANNNTYVWIVLNFSESVWPTYS